MTEIAENIKKLMALEGISPADLSVTTGVERSTLHRILDGSTKNPSIESIKSIIKHYSFDEVVLGVSASGIPIISWTESARYSQNIDFSKHKKIKTSITTSKNSFALVLEHRLNSRFSEGTLLIVDPERKPKNRSYIIIKEGDSLSTSIKRYILDGNTVYLKPLDHTLPSKEYDPRKFKIIGVIVQSIFDFEE